MRKDPAIFVGAANGTFRLSIRTESPTDVLLARGGGHCRACYQQDHHCIFTANCVGRDNYGYFFGFVLWGWIATVYAVWLTAQPYLLCDTDDYRGAPTCSSQYRTLFLVSSLSLVALTLLSSLVVSLAASGQTIRGFLSDRPPLLAVKPGRHLENIEVRLGPAAQWWRLLVPGLGVDTS